MGTIHFDPVTLWVRDFDRCLTFYREVFELEVLRLFRGEGHPPWVEFRMGDSRFCLHGGYGNGSRYRTATPPRRSFRGGRRGRGGRPDQPVRRERRRGIVEEDNRPAELRKVRQAVFSDPDGNEFELLQVVSEYEQAAGD